MKENCDITLLTEAYEKVYVKENDAGKINPLASAASDHIIKQILAAIPNLDDVDTQKQFLQSVTVAIQNMFADIDKNNPRVVDPNWKYKYHW
jgi:hypothetical protein